MAVSAFHTDAKRSKLARQILVALGSLHQVDAELGQPLAKGAHVHVSQLGRVADTDQCVCRNAGLGLQVEQFITCIDRLLDDRRQSTNNRAASDRSPKAGYCTLEA